MEWRGEMECRYCLYDDCRESIVVGDYLVRDALRVVCSFLWFADARCVGRRMLR